MTREYIARVAVCLTARDRACSGVSWAAGRQTRDAPQVQRSLSSRTRTLPSERLWTAHHKRVRYIACRNAWQKEGNVTGVTSIAGCSSPLRSLITFLMWQWQCCCVTKWRHHHHKTTRVGRSLAILHTSFVVIISCRGAGQERLPPLQSSATAAASPMKYLSDLSFCSSV